MKNHITLLFSLLFMGLLLTDCKKSDNPDPDDDGNGGTSTSGISIAGKNVEMKTAIYTYAGAFNGLHKHILALYSFDASESPGFSKSAKYSDYGTSLNFSINTFEEELGDGTYNMNEMDETSPNVDYGTFTPGKEQFQNSSVKGEVYYASELQLKLETSGTTKTITVSGKLVPGSDFYVGNLSNAISFSLKYKGDFISYSTEQ